ncbi:conserved hypothetical protein [Ricinus communis]|uniref:Uncharacterized protein n=1 Tax=Ricinus communis TaxID=3988 RepID=B9REK2_RICCO|nr:conserved hypothetical protein [Ricinus communis]
MSSSIEFTSQAMSIQFSTSQEEYKGSSFILDPVCTRVFLIPEVEEVESSQAVKISDGASLYALCRSWLRNGFLEENQAHYGDFVKVLPRPLPESDVDVHSPRKEGEKEVEEYEEDVECIDNLSAQDLFRIHVKRAKRVRARLRERRLKRIARYKTRLAMLLPPQVEQFRNDSAAGN